VEVVDNRKELGFLVVILATTKGLGDDGFTVGGDSSGLCLLTIHYYY
jgi:hypothetical protein